MLHIAELDSDWLPVPDVAALLGVRLRDVRAMIADSALVGARVAGLEGYRIPASFLDGARVVDGLKGTITQLRDAGLDETEIVRWLLTPSEELGRTPAAALRAGGKHAVRRAAISVAF